MHQSLTPSGPLPQLFLPCHFECWLGQWVPLTQGCYNPVSSRKSCPDPKPRDKRDGTGLYIMPGARYKANDAPWLVNEQLIERLIDWLSYEPRFVYLAWRGRRFTANLAIFNNKILHQGEGVFDPTPIKNNFWKSFSKFFVCIFRFLLKKYVNKLFLLFKIPLGSLSKIKKTEKSG